jgi:hypothetical protein
VWRFFSRKSRYAEQRLDPEERIDVAPLRRELGLDHESR